MIFEQQIKEYEDRISQLEDMKRILLSKISSFSGNEDAEIFENNLRRINVDLDESWQNITILKIRKMMGFYDEEGLG
jgi:hypothetical protein